MADMRTIPPALTPVDIAGFHIRPYRGEEDLPALAELMDASFVANGDTPGANVDELSVELRNLPHIDPTRDPVSYTHLTLPTTRQRCRSRGSAGQ